jgi:segregation and condensation protein B
MNDIERKIEAVLFAVGDPISVKKLSSVTGEEVEAVNQAVSALKEKYLSPESGIHIIEHDTGLQLATKPEVAGVIERLVKSEVHESLSPATLETLSLVSYLGPITKSSLEYIRGVNSSFTLRNLLIRGLVERIPHPKKPNTYLYRPTSDLIRHLGIEKKEDLPDFGKYQELKENLENE